MSGIIIFIATLSLGICTLICLTFFISCIREKERRAAAFGGLQLAVPMALCCPSHSITMEDQREVNGSLRWKLDEETCFEYWGKVGTGCNICMRVCPWSHAGTFPHQLVKILVSQNRMARRLFTAMDDIFYGQKPKSKAPPAWARYN